MLILLPEFMLRTVLGAVVFMLRTVLGAAPSLYIIYIYIYKNIIYIYIYNNICTYIILFMLRTVLGAN